MGAGGVGEVVYEGGGDVEDVFEEVGILAEVGMEEEGGERYKEAGLVVRAGFGALKALAVEEC